MQLIDVGEGPLLDEILRETHTIWADRIDPAPFRQFWLAQLRTAWGREHLCRVALVDGGRVLASTKVYEFTARVDGEAVGVCGLGAVFTQTAHRRSGHARELIDRVLARAVGRGQRLALLFSEIGMDYYARIGFTAVATHDATFRVTPPRQRGAPATMVRAGDDRDYEAVVRLGRAQAAPFRFHLDRDRSVVHYGIVKQRLRAGFGPAGLRELQFFIAEEGTSAVAYVAIGVEGDRWTLLECGDRDVTGARVGAILQVLLAREPSRRPPVIVGRLPPGFLPPQMAVVDRHEAKELMMIRPLGDFRLAAPLAEDQVLYWRNDLF